MPKQPSPANQRARNSRSIVIALWICGLLLFLFFDFMSLLRSRMQPPPYATNTLIEDEIASIKYPEATCEVELSETERAIFDQLHSAYQKHNSQPEIMISSNTSDHLNCAAIDTIIADGIRFVPFVIEKIRAGDHFLDEIVRDMTGDRCDAYTDDVGSSLGSQSRAAAWVWWWEDVGCERYQAWQAERSS